MPDRLPARLIPDPIDLCRGLAAIDRVRITREVREYAAKQGIASADDALAQGMEEKADEFRRSGGDLYVSDSS